jgi:hypothetical protein
MKILSEKCLTSFNFWSGAEDHDFTYNELKSITEVLESDEVDGRTRTETEINDLFWFEEKAICDIIGLDYDEYLAR